MGNGYVIPSWLSAGSGEGHFDTFINNNFSLKSGQVLTIKYPEETQKLKDTQAFIPILYDVMVNEVTDRGRIQTIYYNCQVMDQFGGIADYFEYTLRTNAQYKPADGDTSSQKKSFDLTTTKLSDSKNTDITTLQGAQVLLLCQDGTPQHAFIIGGMKNYQASLNASYTVPTKDNGNYMKFSYNGVNVGINKDGELSIQRMGANDTSGALLDSKDKSPGSLLLIDKTGAVTISTGNNTDDKTTTPSINLTKDGIVTIASGTSNDSSTPKNSIVMDKDGNITITVDAGANLALAKKDGDATLTLGDGSKSATIAEELKNLYNQLKQKLDLFDNHVHPSGTGPTGPPNPTISSPSWADAIVSQSMKLPK